MKGWCYHGLAVLLLMLLTAANANAGCIGNVTGIDYGCGDTVIESCRFNEDLNCSTKYGLVIGADGITIDGAGHAITTNTHSDDGEGIHNEGCDRVTVKNLRIGGFCYGIYWKETDNGSIVDNSIDYTHGSGIWLFSSSQTRISWNSINYGDGGHGILLSNAADDNFIKYNNITTVNGMGVCIDNSSRNTLHHNRVCGNTRGDIIVESGSGNTGCDNTCEIARGYSDDSAAAGCAYPCPSPSETSSDKEVDEPESDNPACGCISMRDSSLIFGCGDTVTESCRFNCDLNCSSGHGLIIGANGITVDGNNHTLNGIIPGDCSGFEIQRSGIFNHGYDGVIIENLEITNFCNGIYLKGDEVTRDIIKNNTIDNCNIHHNGNDIDETATHGIKMHHVYESIIKNNLVHHNKGRGTSCENGGNGIFLNAGDYNLFTNNTIYDNTKAGIFTRMKPKYNNITNNRVTGNGQGGIILRCKLSSFFMIENNIATDNKGPGIYVGGSGNTLRYNTAADNKEGSAYTDDASVANGIRISNEAYDTTLIGNTVTGNDEDDVYVKEGLTGVAGYNNTYKTSSNYIDYSKESEMVRGKEVVRTTETPMNFGSDIEIPSIKVTPLMATLIVVALLIFLIFGYLKTR